MNLKTLISQLSFGNLSVCENAQVENSTRQFEGTNSEAAFPAGKDRHWNDYNG